MRDLTWPKVGAGRPEADCPTVFYRSSVRFEGIYEGAIHLWMARRHLLTNAGEVRL